MASPLKRGNSARLPSHFPSVHDSGPTGPRLLPQGLLHSGTPLSLQGATGALETVIAVSCLLGPVVVKTAKASLFGLRLSGVYH